MLVTEKVPNVEAYQPPLHVPVDAAEPSVHAPVAAYRPGPVVSPPVPSAPRRMPRTGGKGVAVVAALSILLTGGMGLVAVQGKPSSETSVATEAIPVPEAPPAEPAPEPPPAAIAWPDLPALPGSAEQTTWSTLNGGSTWIRFVNDAGETVTVRWLDYDGKRVRYAELAPGQAYDQPTFDGNAWVATWTDGTAAAVFVAGAEPGRAVIR